MTDIEVRTVREQLRYEIFTSLNKIEDLVAETLDRIVDEAVVWGADNQHDFYIDHLAAKTADEIGHELDRMAEKALRILPIVEVG
jgi:hypothetical protein